jgi:hypothetical protein
MPNLAPSPVPPAQAALKSIANSAGTLKGETPMTLPMTPAMTAFAQSPDRGMGLARDMRVRWALEEVGQAYEVRLVSFVAMKEPAQRALHPFGQIPTYEESDLVLFESGAIVFHIAERHTGLLPDAANARAHAIAWMFAAVNTIEPPILDLQATASGVAGRVSEPLRLCRPQRSAARLPACVRRSIGGIHWEVTERLMEVSSGPVAVSEVRPLSRNLNRPISCRE